MPDTAYTNTGLTSNYIGGAPIQGPMYTPPGGKAQPLGSYNAADPNDPTGKYVFNPQTGLNQKGLTPGQQAAQDYQANTSLVNTTKSQPIQNSIDTTLSNENALESGTINNFNQYLAQAQQQMEQQQGSINADQSTMATLPSQLNTELSNAVTQFANTGNSLDTKLTNLNAANTNTVNTNIANLSALQGQAEGAETAAAQKAVADAQAANAARFSAGGTPTSGSGYEQALMANTEAGIMLPVTAANYQQRIGQLENYVTPQQQQLYTQQVSQITGLEMPLAQQLVNLGITNSSQVAQLQAALAGRTLSEQIQFFAQLGIPVQMAQQLAQSLPSAVGQLNATNLSNNNYALTQSYQTPLPGGLPVTNSGTPSIGPGMRYANPGSGGFNSYGSMQAGPTALPTTTGALGGANAGASAGTNYALNNTPGTPGNQPPAYNTVYPQPSYAPYTNQNLADMANLAYQSPMYGVGD